MWEGSIAGGRATGAGRGVGGEGATECGWADGSGAGIGAGALDGFVGDDAGIAGDPEGGEEIDAGMGDGFVGARGGIMGRMGPLEGSDPTFEEGACVEGPG